MDVKISCTAVNLGVYMNMHEYKLEHLFRIAPKECLLQGTDEALQYIQFCKDILILKHIGVIGLGEGWAIPLCARELGTYTFKYTQEDL